MGNDGYKLPKIFAYPKMSTILQKLSASNACMVAAFFVSVGRPLILKLIPNYENCTKKNSMIGVTLIKKFISRCNDMMFKFYVKLQKISIWVEITRIKANLSWAELD